jgi:hypothetical protein
MSEHITQTPPPEDRSVKVPHLVFGLLFLGIAGTWALAVTHVITGDRLAILAPAVLVAAGVIGLAASLASTRNRHRTPTAEQDPYDNDPVTYPAGPEPDDHTQEIR